MVLLLSNNVRPRNRRMASVSRPKNSMTKLGLVVIVIVAGCLCQLTGSQSYGNYYNSRINQAPSATGAKAPSLPSQLFPSAGQNSGQVLSAPTTNANFWVKSPLTVLSGDTNYTNVRQEFLRQLCTRLLTRPNSSAFSFCHSISPPGG